MTEQAPDDIFALYSRFDLDGENYRVFARPEPPKTKSAVGTLTAPEYPAQKYVPEYVTDAMPKERAAPAVAHELQELPLALLANFSTAPADSAEYVHTGQAPAGRSDGESGRAALQNLWQHVKSRPDGRQRVTAESLAAASLSVHGVAGGVGSTTVAAALTSLLAKSGKRCAIFDENGDSTLPFFFGGQRIAEDRRRFSGLHALFEPRIRILNSEMFEAVKPVAAASPSFIERNFADFATDFDHLIFDQRVRCAGAMGAGLRVYVAIPDLSSLAGMQKMLQSLDTESDAKVICVLNRFDPASALHEEVLGWYRESFRNLAILRYSPLLSEALAEGKTVLDWAPDAPVSTDLLNLFRRDEPAIKFRTRRAFEMLLNSDVEKQPSGIGFARTALVVPLLIGLIFLIRMPLIWTDQAIFSAIMVGCCILIGRISDSRFVTSTLAMISVFCTLRYIVWRWSSSIAFLNNSGWNVDRTGLVFALMLLCAETYAVTILLLGYFQSARPLRRRPATLPPDVSVWPSVDVFIPTYNEPIEVVRPTVLAAMGIDWPPDRLKIYILDDGRRPQFEEFAAECGVGYMTRFDNAHAKAGNINAALKNTHGEYVAIFDCDHIATRSFLQLTMGWFNKDSRLAMVQTPHHFYSPDPFERNLNVFRTIPNEGALFYGVVQDGNDLWNATFFCGSCAVIKREALEEIGGIAVETVTEDAHTALRLQRRGWNTAYLGIPQAAGLATGSLAAHIGQRIRWARGMVQILRVDFPLFGGGLSLPQRLCYLNCAAHYLYAIPRLVFVSAPLVYLLLGKSNLYGLIWEILAYAAPHLILSNMVNSRSQGDYRHSFWNEVYEMVLAPYILLPTTFALINPKWGKFNVTSKSSVVEESFFDWRIARPYLFLLALNIIAIIIAIPRYFTSEGSPGVLLVNVVWALLNTLLLGACIAVSFESKQRRSTVRVETTLMATLALGPNDAHHCRVIDLSEGGLSLRAERALNCSPGRPAIVTIRAGDDEFRFDAETVRTNENRIHLRFPDTQLKHQRAITKIMYARADSWLDWSKDQRRDRILSSLVNVFGIGARGIWMLPSMLIKREAKPLPGARKPVRKPLLLPGVLLAALLLPLFHSHAQQISIPNSALPAAAASAKGEETFQDHQTFADFGLKSALVLRGDKSKGIVSVNVPGTKIVDSADLAIHYLPGEISGENSLQLAVTLNDVEVARIAVAGGRGTPAVAHVTLPADLLVHDNAIAFELRRQCSAPCPSTNQDALSVRIETASELATSGVVLRLPNRLSMLPSPFFDPSVHRSIDVPFVFESQPDTSSLKAAGVLASWYGALAGYRGSHFITSVGQFPKGNVILLARSDGALAISLGLGGGVGGADAQVAVCDNPSDRYGKVLALVADSSGNLVRLSQFVARNRFVEDGDRLSISAERLADPPASARPPSWFETTQPLRITRDLNDNLLHARIGSATSLYFRIAPDLDYGARITVPLRLAFRLSGLSGEDRVWIAIRLNNTFVAKRRLSSADCLDAQLQSFAIPVSLLYASNTLNVELTTDRVDTNVSDPASVDLQILAATSLDLQNPMHYVRMPRLDLFAAAGYPFTANVDGNETAVVLPEFPSAAQVGLYLDAMGFMSAQTGVSAVGFELSNARNLAASHDRNFLVLGSGNDETPFRPFERSMVVIPTNGKFELSERPLPWQEWFSRAWLGRKEETESLLALIERGDGAKLLIEQFASPFRDDRSVIVLATRSETDSQPYFDRLAEASRAGLVNGAISLADDRNFWSFQLNSGSYALGRGVSLASSYGWLRFHLWILPLLIIASAMGVAGWWEELLERQAKKRLQAIA